MYVYGPVPSRRLGRSLGVSPIPAKTCCYDCVYCQLGHTSRMQTNRESFFKREDIFAELAARARKVSPDYVTFIGDGEPTLCRDIGWLIEKTRRELELPVAVVTNGALLSRKDVRQDLAGANIVIPSMDAGDETTYNKINRPHRGIDFSTMMRGQVDFSREFSGKVWLEVMLVSGLNDSEEELTGIRQVVDAIAPDRVYILAPIRPPAESWVRVPEPSAIFRAQQIIGEAVPVVGLENGNFGLQYFTNARDAILEIGSRHPLRREQAEYIEKYFQDTGILEELLSEGELKETVYADKIYLLPKHFIRV